MSSVDLIARLRGDSSGLVRAADQASSALQGTGSTGETSMLAVGAAAGIAAAATTKLIELAGEAASALNLVGQAVDRAADIDRIAKTAGTIGALTSELDTLQGAFGLGGVSADETSTALQRLQRTLGDLAQGSTEAVPTFEALGLTFEGMADQSITDQVLTLASALESSESPALAAAAASDLFGRAGVRMLSAFRDGAGGLERAIELVEAAGTVSDEAAARSEQLTDSVALQSRAWVSLRDQALSPIMPVLAATADAITEVLGYLRETGIVEDFGQTWARVFGEQIVPALAVFGEVGLKVLATITPALAGLDVVVLSLEASFHRFFSFTDAGFEAANQATRDLGEAQDRLAQSIRDLGAEQEAIEELIGRVVDNTARSAIEYGRASSAVRGFSGALATATDEAEGQADAVVDISRALDQFAAAQARATSDTLTASQRIQQARDRELDQVFDLYSQIVETAGLSEAERVRLHESAAEAMSAIDARAGRELEQQTKLQTEQIVQLVLETTSEVLSAVESLVADSYQKRADAAREFASRSEEVAQQLERSTNQMERRRLQAELSRLRTAEREQKRLALREFRRSQALAITQAAINTALAITNAIATAPNYIVGAIQAIAAGITGGAQIGIIASQSPPQLHRGGGFDDPLVSRASLADEQLRLMRRNEAVLTPTGVSASGGIGEVRRRNAGEPAAGGQVFVINQVGARVLDAQTAVSLRDPRSPLGMVNRKARGYALGAASVYGSRRR